MADRDTRDRPLPLRQRIAKRRTDRTARRLAARERARTGRFFRWLLVAACLGLLLYALVAVALWRLAT